MEWHSNETFLQDKITTNQTISYDISNHHYLVIHKYLILDH